MASNTVLLTHNKLLIGVCRNKEAVFLITCIKLVTLQLPSCRPLKLPSLALFSEQMNLKNKTVQIYQKKKEVPYMETSGDNAQKRKGSPYMDKSRDND